MRFRVSVVLFEPVRYLFEKVVGYSYCSCWRLTACPRRSRFDRVSCIFFMPYNLCTSLVARWFNVNYLRASIYRAFFLPKLRRAVRVRVRCVSRVGRYCGVLIRWRAMYWVCFVERDEKQTYRAVSC